jgi:hypothetical protein
MMLTKKEIKDLVIGIVKMRFIGRLEALFAELNDICDKTSRKKKK